MTSSEEQRWLYVEDEKPSTPRKGTMITVYAGGKPVQHLRVVDVKPADEDGIVRLEVEPADPPQEVAT